MYVCMCVHMCVRACVCISFLGTDYHLCKKDADNPRDGAGSKQNEQNNPCKIKETHDEAYKRAYEEAACKALIEAFKD